MSRLWVPVGAVVAVTVGGFVLLDPLTSSLQANEQLPVSPVAVTTPRLPRVVGSATPEAVSLSRGSGAKRVPVVIKTRRTSSTSAAVSTRQSTTVRTSVTPSTPATQTRTSTPVKQAKAPKAPKTQKPVGNVGERNGSSGLADANSKNPLPPVGAQSFSPAR